MRTKKRRGSRVALLLIDFMNPLDFDGAKLLAPRAVRAAQRAAGLRRRMAAKGAHVIYANDNFGRWESDFKAVVADCQNRGGASAAMARFACAPGYRSLAAETTALGILRHAAR